ncbi:MAG: sulfatase [Planctomycetes bacterium]|nr:sulfatase [Planctomycetota bacterium]
MNAIVICLDTLRWDALGCYHDWVQTPCIDRYAQSATKFNAAFCGSFPTVPMRVDAYTGDVNWPRVGWVGIDEDRPKLPALLRDAGYFTGLVLDTWNNVRVGLSDCYDEYFLIEKDVDDGFTREDVDIPVPLANMRQNGGGFLSDRIRTSHYRHEQDWFVARTMMRASEWLEDNYTKEKFFLWVDTFEIHEDWNPPKHYVDYYSEDYEGLDYSYPNYGYTDIYQPHELERLRARYAGEVTLTDRWVGHLLRHIELLGLFENTTIILTSDHGMYIGEHKRAGKHTVDPEDPWPLYDTVARVPLLVWTPFDAPKEIDALCQAADIMPTVLDLCDVTPPETVGNSWVPLLKGQAQECHDTLFTSCHSGSGPGRIDYLPSHITVTTMTHTAIFGRPPHKPELYDRKKDPEQESDIAADNPDIVGGLRAELVAFMERQGADADYIGTYAKGE